MSSLVRSISSTSSPLVLSGASIVFCEINLQYDDCYNARVFIRNVRTPKSLIWADARAPHYTRIRDVSPGL